MNTHKCRYGCGKVIVFDGGLPSPPFFEQDTGIHHTYKRCAEILGSDKAKEAFAKDAEERKAKKKQQEQQPQK